MSTRLEAAGFRLSRILEDLWYRRPFVLSSTMHREAREALLRGLETGRAQGRDRSEAHQ